MEEKEGRRGEREKKRSWGGEKLFARPLWDQVSFVSLKRDFSHSGQQPEKRPNALEPTNHRDASSLTEFTA